MSYGRDKTIFVHPFTFFIVNGLTDVFVTLKTKTESDAVKQLHWFMYFLDPEIKTALADEMLETRNYMDGTITYQRKDVEALLNKIMIALHVAGYFQAAKFGPATKTTTMKDLKMKLEKAIYGKKKKE